MDRLRERFQQSIVGGIAAIAVGLILIWLLYKLAQLLISNAGAIAVALGAVLVLLILAALVMRRRPS